MLRNLFSSMTFLLVSTTGILFGSLQEDIDRATTILQEFEGIPEDSIPPYVLKDAQGLVIISIIKGAFGLSGRGGEGLIVAKTASGWSAPSAIGIGGVGIGPQIGLEMTDFIFVLNTKDAVDAFANKGNVSLGADVSIAAGPMGRSAEGQVLTKAAVYTYSKSQGLFAGISLEGTILAVRSEANEQFYKKSVTPRELLSGKIPPPASAKPLYTALDKYK